MGNGVVTSISIGMDEYLDKIYEDKEVIHTYKITDYEGNKRFWRDWEYRMIKALGNKDWMNMD